MKTWADEKTYIPKNPCKRCGTSLRYKSNYGCAECLRSSNREYQSKNRETLLPKKREWAKSNPEKNRAQSNKWQFENRKLATEIQKRARHAKWESHYKPRLKAIAAKRRASLLQRTPAWADLEAIKRIYADCPVGMEVDHVIPLMGKKVSGLHIETNLQYLTKKENSSKGAKYEIVV